MTTTKKNLIKILLGAVIALAAMLLIPALKAEAAQTEITIESSDEADTSVLLDDDFHTFDYYNEKTQLCIKSSEVMTGIYIKWDTIPGSWKLIIDGQEYVYGQNDFIHEYVELPVASDTVYMVMAKDRTYITDIYGFTAGELPSWVQVWQPAYEKADILLYSTHADDECIFFGGIIPNYTNNNRARVEVAYFTDQWKEGVNGTEDYRNHEKLDGLWTMGVDHYPAMGEFPDLYSESIEEARSSFDNDHALEYTVELIRRFKPQVLVGQDLINGEYGHGGHMYTAWLLTEAVEKAN
ncbi:MAG: PIG-L family deacetylase, partial [Parasporobacterium sp.]|nr:PIG-L family deacetylase [Parasporobacterium sp.]